MFGEYSDARNSLIEVSERAHAKINPLLLVGKGQEDGYHPVVTVLQNIELHDDVSLRVWPGQEPGRSGDIEVATDDPRLPDGIDNLAGLAAARMLEHAGLSHYSVRIDITKRIPVAAGLAGGSADAAAVLRGLRKCLDLDLSERELLTIAAGLGSDVPACLVGGTLLCEGRGEKVRPIESKRLWWVLANPGVSLSTADVYRQFDHMAPAAGVRQLDLPVDQIVPGFTACLKRGELRRLAQTVQNDLEPSAVALRPEISKLLTAMRNFGCLATLVSGSGPTVAGLVLDQSHAQGIAARVSELAPWVWWGPSISRTEIEP